MLPRSLRYFLLALRYPDWRDFTLMGLGIEARRERARGYWEKHEKLTKEIQITALLGVGPVRSAAILGAGRLYDVAWGHLINNVERIELYDADPGAAAVWQRAVAGSAQNKQVFCYLSDLTGALEGWSSRLREVLKKKSKNKDEELIDFLSRCAIPERKEHIQADVVFSLNLLSQISLYWRDRFLTMVKKYWRLTEEEFSQALSLALHRTYKVLQEDHLRLLSQSKAKTIVLITDQFFFYYQDDIASWQEEEALELTWPLKIAHYNLQKESSWLWHLAPQGKAQPSFGEIHQVWAGMFKREDS